MSRDLISKSVIRGSMLVFIPENVVCDSVMIVISHGSGGMSEADFTVAQEFYDLGYKVAINDYFRKVNVERLWWNYEITPYKHSVDDHDCKFTDMFLFDAAFDEDLIHIGFSLGGTLGLVNHHQFTHNFSFYPGIIGFTESMLHDDYSNCTTFIAELDDWCDNYNTFASKCTSPPQEIIVKGAHHGFMQHGKDHTFSIAKYGFPDEPLSDDEFNALKPNHYQLADKFGFHLDQTRIKSHPVARDTYLQYIKDYLNDHYDSST